MFFSGLVFDEVRAQGWRYDASREIPTVWFHRVKVVNYGVPAYFSGKIECRYPVISLQYNTPDQLNVSILETLRTLTSASRFWIRVDSNEIRSINLEMAPVTAVPIFSTAVNDDILSELMAAKQSIYISGRNDLGGFDYQIFRSDGSVRAISTMAKACISKETSR